MHSYPEDVRPGTEYNTGSGAFFSSFVVDMGTLTGIWKRLLHFILLVD